MAGSPSQSYPAADPPTPEEQGRCDRRTERYNTNLFRCFLEAAHQEPGLGFPMIRMVVLLSLATAAVLDMAMGPYQGKETGEQIALPCSPQYGGTGVEIKEALMMSLGTAGRRDRRDLGASCPSVSMVPGASDRNTGDTLCRDPV